MSFPIDICNGIEQTDFPYNRIIHEFTSRSKTKSAMMPLPVTKATVKNTQIICNKREENQMLISNHKFYECTHAKHLFNGTNGN
jgi:hypothetical protein